MAYRQDELRSLLKASGDPMMPELDRAVQNPEQVKDRPATRLLMDQAANMLADVRNMPQLTYTLYREVQRKTDRLPYQSAYFEKRGKLALSAIWVVLGDEAYLDILHDYLWSICEETVWVLPQVEHITIELRAAAVALDVAEIVCALKDRIEDRVIARVKAEVNRRIFEPYLANPEQFHWYLGKNNWNGVCNGGVGGAFLLLEDDEDRLAQAVAVVLKGLDVFLESAFEPDGSSAEGVGYWQYGLGNLICFAEMLRLRTQGAIDFLAQDRLQAIARYPLHAMLSPGHYFAYSDCNEATSLEPGFVARLVERTGVGELLGVLAEPAPLSMGVRSFHNAWRNMLWWDGSRPEKPVVDDVWMKESEVVRVVSPASDGMVLAAKAGHNGVSHNHNDVGHFVLHVDGETLLCDPERGLYDLYRRHGRTANIFMNSFGHSVPCIGEALQGEGARYFGTITRYDVAGEEKCVEMDIQDAYDVAGLESVHRCLRLTGDLVIEDTFLFSDAPLPIEEAFVTWCDATVSGQTAQVTGERHSVQMEIESPDDVYWALDVLEEASKENRKPTPLKRLSFNFIPSQKTATVRVRVTVLFA